MEVEKLLLELVKIPSVSGNEKSVGKFIVERLKKNFKIRTQIVDEAIGNFNIFAYIGKPKILLNAHMDTVPGKLKVYEDKKNIYGRGACDTKASIASMIIAAERLLASGMTDFGLLFDVDEEGEFSGAKKVLSIIPKSVKLVVVGEPTKLKLVYGQNGIVDMKISCRGKSAHGSMPERGKNAIELIMSNLQILKELNLPENETLGANVINVAKISGGTAGNIVPDYAEVQVVIRSSVNSKLLLKSLMKKFYRCKLETLIFEPVVFPELTSIGKRLNIKTETVPYFTEMYFFSKKSKTFIFGPGDARYAHSENERVSKSELAKAVEKYIEMATLINEETLNKPDEVKK